MVADSRWFQRSEYPLRLRGFREVSIRCAFVVSEKWDMVKHTCCRSQ